MTTNLNRFTIIFTRLKEYEEIESSPTDQQNASLDEMDEIAELRRIVHEIIEPEQFSYTTT